MTQNRTTTGNARKPKPDPAFIAYSVSDRGRGRKFWHRLGGVYPHKNGDGLTVFMDVIPVDFDGRIVLLPPKPEDADGDTKAFDTETGETGGELEEIAF